MVINLWINETHQGTAVPPTGGHIQKCPYFEGADKQQIDTQEFPQMRIDLFCILNKDISVHVHDFHTFDRIVHGQNLPMKIKLMQTKQGISDGVKSPSV